MNAPDIIKGRVYVYHFTSKLYQVRYNYSCRDGDSYANSDACDSTIKPTHTARLLPAASLAGLARSASTADLLSMVLQLSGTWKFIHTNT